MADAHAQAGKYYVPHSSKWPIIASASFFTLLLGVICLLNDWGPAWAMVPGFAAVVYMFIGWFGDVIKENNSGIYGLDVDRSFRMGMMWFIFSEVMFFAAFFGALFYVRNLSVPELGSPEQRLLWPNFTAFWPTNGPYLKDAFTPMEAIGIPLLNTIILVSSGGTLTVAHHALKTGNRMALKLWLFVTIMLGFTFLGFQAYEYTHAYSALNLKLSTGVYGSTFFMLTGFHGFHVTIGAIMLSVMLGRSIRGHFDAEHHFAFEAAAWYWHFVDVVWLLLFVLVYWL